MMKNTVNLLILILIIFLTACTPFSSNDYVLTIDGEKISKTEYNVYLDEQIKQFESQGGKDIWGVDFDGIPATDVAKQNAINSIVMVKAAVNHSEQLGVTLTDEDKANAHKRAEDLKDETSDIELLNRIMEESAIQGKVYDKITGSYQINNDEFENYLNQYYSQNKDKYTKYTAKEIFIQSTDTRYTYDDIKERFDNIQSDSDFTKFAKEVFPDNTLQPQQLDESLYAESVIQQLSTASKGDYILAEDTTGYHIFYIVDISQTPMDEIRESVKADYITQQKQEIYNTQNSTWTSTMSVEKNAPVYDAIKIEDVVTETTTK